MDSRIKTYSYPDGTIQRVQRVCLDSWESLGFLALSGGDGMLDCLANIYRQYLIPACPWLFGNLVLFSLPEEMGSLTAAAACLRQGVRIQKEKPRFRNAEAAQLWGQLEMHGCIRIVRGKLPTTQIIPVGNGLGLLSETEPQAAMKVNASFFIMDPFDCATVYDHVGTCLGLRVKDGVITNPPQYDREALLVRTDSSVTVENWDIRQLPIQIGEQIYRHGENATVYTRPRHTRVRGQGTKLVIVGSHVEAVCRKGSALVPASGYVLRLQKDCPVKPGEKVFYPAMEDVTFGIQVGNSLVRDGARTDRFRSKFYKIRHLEPVPFPPSLYPMDFNRSRAARIALGSDNSGKPVLLWAEGSPKLGYEPGCHSRGASLLDMGQYCLDAGMVQAVNLDGGGSAQLLLRGQRMLEISDRTPDHSQAERLIPNALIVK